MAMLHAGIMRLDAVMLRDALGLPKSTRITHIVQDWNDVCGRSFTVRMEGASLPKIESGKRIPEVFAQFHQDGDKWTFDRFIVSGTSEKAT